MSAAADLSVLRMSNAEHWLIASAHIGSNTRAARMVLATKRELDGLGRRGELPARAIRCPFEAVRWLRDVALNDAQDAQHAAEILGALGESVHHAILVDEDVAYSHARSLKGQGFVGVRVVPCDSGFSVRSQGRAP